MPPPTRAFAPLDLMQLIAIALIWGVNNIFAKLTVDALPALMTVALRFLLVLVALFVWLRPPPSERPHPTTARSRPRDPARAHHLPSAVTRPSRYGRPRLVRLARRGRT